MMGAKNYNNIFNKIWIAGLLLLLLPAFFIFSKKTVAQGVVVINEIAWMGTKASSADEWIELYNNSDQEIILDDWQLQEGSNETIIKLKGKIAPGAYYLIERTDDTAVADVPADLFGSWGGSGLSNNGEKIILKDAGLNSIDEVDCSAGWFAGTASPDYKTAERIDPAFSGSLASNWHTNSGSPINGADAKGNAIQGTPRSKNSEPAPASPSPLPSDSAQPSASSKTQTQQAGPQYQFSNDVSISEFMPRPPTGQKEWIEIYNSGNEPIHLYDWQISDSPDIGNKQKIPEGSFINPDSYFVIEINKDFLNNEGDQINLLWPNDQLIHSVIYPSSEQNLSCIRLKNGQWAWTSQPTPGQPNKESAVVPQIKREQIAPIAQSRIESIAAPLKTILPTTQVLLPTPAPPAPSSPISPIETAPIESKNVQTAAAIGQSINQGKDKSWLALGSMIILAGGAGLGLIYFRRQKNRTIDVQKSNDNII